MLQETADNSVIIISHPAATIKGTSPDIIVNMEDDYSVSLSQEGDMIALSPDEAEALFLVLDTMLHSDE